MVLCGICGVFHSPHLVVKWGTRGCGLGVCAPLLCRFVTLGAGFVQCGGVGFVGDEV
jgi:hypothetical protein